MWAAQGHPDLSDQLTTLTRYEDSNRPNSQTADSTIDLDRVWAKAAGRCCVCGASLLDASLQEVTVPIGEVAYRVGATDGPKSPRGESDTPVEARNSEADLMLLCDSCHPGRRRSGGGSRRSIGATRRSCAR